MKRNFKMGVSLALTGIMILGSLTPVFATVDETQTTSENETLATDVLYNQDSSFTVTIPKLITLDSTTKDSAYTVTIEGDIASNEQINVVPDETFEMIDQATTGAKKDNVEATVEQDKTAWVFNEFATIGNGNVKALDLTAGNWKGSFFFNISLDSLENESIILEAGLYDANGVLLDKWEDTGIDITANPNYTGDSSYLNTGSKIIPNNYPTATTVVLPEGITYIGKYTFSGLTTVSNITIPSSVTHIYNYAFKDCSNAFTGELDLSNVTSLDSFAFLNCSKIESVILSDELTSLGTAGPTFQNCINLSEVIYKGETYTSYTLLNTVLKENGVTFTGGNSTGNPFQGTALTE